MDSLLNDKNTYTIVTKNPLKKLQNNTSTILQDLSENLGRPMLKKITLTHTNIPKAYGLLKIHKIDIH